ncbi:hypothetical protein QBC43DRAFT_212913 [Cladorrhinum sp. PSN259]|nr:hypothetical protein QBC43DRAFT_212913 [Cladorrhinum sp. PSN259]
MEKSTRSQHSASSFEADSQDLYLQSKMRTIRTVDTARVGVTGLALLMGLTVLGVSANTLRVHHHTSVPSEYFLSLWPEEFSIRPTVALVAGSVFVVVSSILSLVFSKMSSLRSKKLAHTSCSFASPLVGLIAALVAVILFYSINASETVDTFTSWTCRWRHVSMSQQPHWGTLCQQSYAGLYLAILLIPVEAIALGLAAFQMKLERYTEKYEGAKKSPALS